MSNQTLGANKVLVVGIDGATFNLIKPWVSAGKLPSLGRFLKSGSHGILKSTIHPSSPPAWASFQTGANPGRHGIFDFISLRDGGSFLPISSNSLSVEPFWKILSRCGKKVGLINIIGTYPPYPVNGFLISGMLATNKGAASYPPGLMKEIEDRLGKYIIEIDVNEIKERAPSPLAFRREYFATLKEIVKIRGNTTRYLLQEKAWDLFVVIFTASDRIQHYYWKYMDDQFIKCSPEEKEEFGNAILEIYQQIDRELGLIFDAVDDDCYKLIVSDHGASPLHKLVNLNSWLHLNGFLTISDEAKRAVLKSYLKKIKRAAGKSIIGKPLKNLTRPPGPRLIEQELTDVNWEKTRAFAIGRMGNILINLKGRQPMGIVEPGKEYEDLCQQLVERLQAFTLPDSGKKIVKKVHRREELYQGTRVEDAPDLIIEWEDYSLVGLYSGNPGEELFYETKYYADSLQLSSNHNLRGVIMANGPHIRPGSIENAQIMDIAPTIFYMLGDKIPNTFDGQVITGLFQPDFLAAQPILHEDIVVTEDREAEDTVFSGQEIAQLKERLKGLGYLE